jgi:hypothetical protein
MTFDLRLSTFPISASAQLERGKKIAIAVSIAAAALYKFA